MVYAEKGLDMARRFDDPALIAANLGGMNYALAGPEHAQQRLANATEMLRLAKAANAHSGRRTLMARILPARAGRYAGS